MSMNSLSVEESRHSKSGRGRLHGWSFTRGGGDFTYERGGDARREFWIKPPKETDLGLAQAFFDP